MSLLAFALSLLKWAWTLCRGNWIILEIRCNTFDKKEMRTYVHDVVRHIRKSFPHAQVLLTKKADDIESRNHPFLAFDGYRILLSKTVEPWELKNLCMELEINHEGQRIADIDLYCGIEKISRKTLGAAINKKPVTL